MRVLHLLSSTGFHGAERMTYELIRQLSAIGVENSVGAFWSNSSSDTHIVHLSKPWVADATVFRCHGRVDLRAITALRRYIVKNRIDVVHSHKYKTNVYSLLACVGLECVLVSTCHNWLPGGLMMRLYTALDKRILAFFDAAVGVSGEVYAELRKHLAADRAYRVGNGVDMDCFLTGMSKEQAKVALGCAGKRVIGFVGRLSASKGLSDLLVALKEVFIENADIHLLVVGDGDQRGALTEQVRTLGMESHVSFLGSRDDTPLLYRAFDMFVLPSHREAFPMVVLEAMAAGVPVVATRVGDVSFILGDEAEEDIVAAGDVMGLTQAIKRILADPVRATERACAGRVRVANLFSARAMAENYRQIYERALARRHARHDGLTADAQSVGSTHTPIKTPQRIRKG